MRRNKWLRGVLCAGGIAAASVLSGCAGSMALIGTPVRGPAVTAEILTEAAETETAEPQVCVFVCGSVAAPGVYALCPDARVADAVAAAGGFSAGADTESCNLAKRIMDGEQIRIPSREEALAAWISGGQASVNVNLNTADREELMTLSGIGEVRAQAIIDYREKNGPFEAIEDITQVSGIGKAAFEKIRDRITV